MRSVTSRDVVTALFDAFGRRDLDTALALVTEDVELWPYGTATAMERSEPYRGHAGIREYYDDLAALWAELVVTPGELRAAGNGVVAFGTANGRTVSGEEHRGVPVIWVFRLDHGRVASARISPTGALPEPP